MELIERFAELVNAPPERIALDEGALLIASCAQPDLDMRRELARLDELAATIETRTVEGVAHRLFRELNFIGNASDYYDPANSFLNQVIDRRLGLPITLSVLVIELARRVQVAMHGVAMPGHFLVRGAGHDNRFLDPFTGGRLLDAASCQRLFHTLHGEQEPFLDLYLAPVTNDIILRRMLENLRLVYRRQGDTASLHWVLELIVRFPFALAPDYRELGTVANTRGAFERAADAFDTAADLDEAANRDVAGDRAQARLLRARLN